MREKVVFDTNAYIGIFNRGLYQHEVNRFNKVVFLVHPVLHELWMGARGKAEILHLARFGKTFVKLGRLVQPEPSTQIMIGRVCRELRFSGKLDTTNRKLSNDVSRTPQLLRRTLSPHRFEGINQAIGRGVVGVDRLTAL